jgi:hypothetical protein
MNTKFFDSVFGGDSANGIKLCMGLAEGDFWTRYSGTQVLYEGSDDTNINFNKIIAASNINASSLQIPAGEPSSSMLYVVRRINCCGIEEETISAAVKVAFDAVGNLIEHTCNKVFTASFEQIDENRVLLKWFYQPINQAKKIGGFKIYSDSGTGEINYQNPIGTVDYIGRKFYQFIAGKLVGDRFKFSIRAVASNDDENSFGDEIKLQFDRSKLDDILLLQSKVN